MQRYGYVTLVKCNLETGRTHQIRAHFKHIGHPLFNDETYGGDKILKGTTFTKYKQFVENCFKLIPRQALHAKTLGFIHPSSQEKVFFDTELPPDFTAVLAKWNDYSTANAGDKS
jgi:23S rRNA pseudouridine1911/1915/1917 synthase